MRGKMETCSAMVLIQVLSKTLPYLFFALASAHIEGATTINLDFLILHVKYLSRLCILAWLHTHKTAEYKECLYATLLLAKHLLGPCQCLRRLAWALWLWSLQRASLCSQELVPATTSHSGMRAGFFSGTWKKCRWGHLLLKPNDREKQMQWFLCSFFQNGYTFLGIPG